MTEAIKYYKPDEIEKKSFEIISENLKGRLFLDWQEPIIKRVIHTTADFEYAETLKFHPQSVENAKKAIKSGCGIVTDTKMAMAGINMRILDKFGCHVSCYISDEDVISEAKSREATRATVSMEKASKLIDNKIFVIGNAPTALIRLHELIKEGIVKPEVVIAVPVGFVNVVESKELIMESGVPYIVSQGRKGGSNVAAAIVNAIQYMMEA